MEGWIQLWYIWYVVRTFVNATMYPHQAQQWKTRFLKRKKRKVNSRLKMFLEWLLNNSLNINYLDHTQFENRILNR
jgi:hypothetical protein